VDIFEFESTTVLRIQCNSSCHSGIMQSLDIQYYASQIDHIILRSYYDILTPSNTTIITLDIQYLNTETLSEWSDVYELEYKSQKFGIWANDSLSIMSFQALTQDYVNVVLKGLIIHIFLTSPGEIFLKDIGLSIYTNDN